MSDVKANNGAQINLLRERKRYLQRRWSKYSRIQRIAVVFAGVYAGLVVAFVSAVEFYYERRAKQLEQNIASEIRAIDAMQEKELKQALLVYRVGLLEGLFKKKGDEREVAVALYQSLPQGVQVNRVQLGEGDPKLEISGAAREVFALRKYLDFIIDLVGSDEFSKVTMPGLSRGLDARYSFNATLDISSDRDSEVRR